MEDTKVTTSESIGFTASLASKGRQLMRSNEFGITVVLIGVVIIIGAFRPGFFSFNSVSNVVQKSAFYGIMALGMVFLLSMGEIDLSIGSAYAVSIAVGAVLIQSGLNPWLGGLMCIVVGVGLGAFNGILANSLRIPVIIITLGGLRMYRGLTLLITGNQTVFGLPREHAFFQIVGGRVFDIPVVVWTFLLLTVVLSVIYTRTRFGFVIRAIGSNRKAAELSGISLHHYRMLALMLVGGLGGISGMLTLAFFSTADPNLGTGYELQAIAAAIIGGTALSGGQGTVVGALVGSLVIGVIGSGIVQFGVSANWSVFVTGAMIIVAVAIDALIRRRRGDM